MCESMYEYMYRSYSLTKDEVNQLSVTPCPPVSSFSRTPFILQCSYACRDATLSASAARALREPSLPPHSLFSGLRLLGVLRILFEPLFSKLSGRLLLEGPDYTRCVSSHVPGTADSKRFVGGRGVLGLSDLE